MASRIRIDRTQIELIPHEVTPQAYLYGRAQRIFHIARTLCPVDTGHLRASIRVVRIPGTGGFRIGTDVDYAIYVEFGTRYMHAQPFLRPALR